MLYVCVYVFGLDTWNMLHVWSRAWKRDKYGKQVERMGYPLIKSDPWPGSLVNVDCPETTPAWAIQGNLNLVPSYQGAQLLFWSSYPYPKWYLVVSVLDRLPFLFRLRCRKAGCNNRRILISDQSFEGGKQLTQLWPIWFCRVPGSRFQIFAEIFTSLICPCRCLGHTQFLAARVIVAAITMSGNK